LATAAALNTRSAWGQPPTIDQLLEQYNSDPAILENAWLYRDMTVSRGVGRGTPSTRQISPKSIDIIVRLEVGSKDRYEQVYQVPIWPKGQSGVTIAIGYDLRFATTPVLQRDWGTLVDATMLRRLEPALGVGGPRAGPLARGLRDVRIPWDPAMTQFRAFLPYAIADTEEIFPNCSQLSDDSLGALVSLVYNRGKALPLGSPRRREMVTIRDLMVARNFRAIPEQFRKMKRLWTDADSRGLVIRREIEAKLFEGGLT
jgi:hypothetical protein